MLENLQFSKNFQEFPRISNFYYVFPTFQLSGGSWARPGPGMGLGWAWPGQSMSKNLWKPKVFQLFCGRMLEKPSFFQLYWWRMLENLQFSNFFNQNSWKTFNFPRISKNFQEFPTFIMFFQLSNFLEGLGASLQSRPAPGLAKDLPKRWKVGKT